MAILVGGFFTLLGLLILQTAVVSRLPLLYGSADLFILFLSSWALQTKTTKSFEFAFLAGVMSGLVSALPGYIYLITYFGIVFLAYQLKKRVWQTPLIAVAFTIMAGLIFEHALTIIWLKIGGVPFLISDAISWVSVPTLLLNLLIAIPLYAIIADIAGSIYPTEGEL